MTEEQIQKARERLQNMRLIDNEIMNTALKDNNEAAEYIIRIILEKDDITVIKTEIQGYQALPNNRSVIMDVVAVDKEGKRYNIEMQNRAENATPLRGRYHCSVLDNGMLSKGESYTDLKESYVIFITDGPFLDYSEEDPIEYFKRTGVRRKKLYNDGQTIVYVNAKCTKGDGALAQLMRDITARSLEEIHSKVLRDAVEYAKGQRGIEMFIEGLNENQDEIWENSAKATQRLDLFKCYSKGISVSKITEIFDMDKDQVETIIKELSTEKQNVH